MTKNLSENLPAIRPYQTTWPALADGVYIDPHAVVIGRVTIGENSSVWPGTVIRGDVNEITIGKNTNIQDGSMCHVTHLGDYSETGHALIIGDDVTIGHKVVLHGATIQNRVLVGMGAIILDGVIVEDDVMIGAGSVVSPGKVLESGHLYLGTPARKIRPLTEKELSFLGYSAKHYVKLKDKYLANSAL